MKCGEEWTAWEPPCKREGLPLISNIHDCGYHGRIPFLLDRKLPGVLATWSFCGFGKVIF